MKYLYLFLISFALFTGCESTILDTYDSDPPPSIAYSLPTDCYVKLTLENSYDTIVATFVDAPQAAGPYRFSIESNKFPEGIYFFNLTAKGINDNSYFESTKRKILIKK